MLTTETASEAISMECTEHKLTMELKVKASFRAHYSCEHKFTLGTEAAAVSNNFSVFQSGE